MNQHPSAETIHAAVTTLHGQAKILMSGHPTLIQALTLMTETSEGPVRATFERGRTKTIKIMWVTTPNAVTWDFFSIPDVTDINSMLMA
jgi:hypothetical protein